MISGPSNDNRIKLLNECFLKLCLTFHNHFTDILSYLRYVFVRRLDKQFSFIFSEISAEEVKPIVYMDSPLVVSSFSEGL